MFVSSRLLIVYYNITVLYVCVHMYVRTYTIHCALCTMQYAKIMQEIAKLKSKEAEADPSSVPTREFDESYNAQPQAYDAYNAPSGDKYEASFDDRDQSDNRRDHYRREGDIDDAVPGDARRTKYDYGHPESGQDRPSYDFPPARGSGDPGEKDLDYHYPPRLPYRDSRRSPPPPPHGYPPVKEYPHYPGHVREGHVRERPGEERARIRDLSPPPRLEGHDYPYARPPYVDPDDRGPPPLAREQMLHDHPPPLPPIRPTDYRGPPLDEPPLPVSVVREREGRKAGSILSQMESIDYSHGTMQGSNVKTVDYHHGSSYQPPLPRNFPQGGASFPYEGYPPYGEIPPGGFMQFGGPGGYLHPGGLDPVSIFAAYQGGTYTWMLYRHVHSVMYVQ